MLKKEWASYARRRARVVEVAVLSYRGRLKGLENWSLSDGAGPFSYQESGLSHSLSGGKNSCRFACRRIKEKSKGLADC